MGLVSKLFLRNQKERQVILHYMLADTLPKQRYSGSSYLGEDGSADAKSILNVARCSIPFIPFIPDKTLYQTDERLYGSWEIYFCYGGRKRSAD